MYRIGPDPAQRSHVPREGEEARDKSIVLHTSSPSPPSPLKNMRLLLALPILLAAERARVILDNFTPPPPPQATVTLATKPTSPRNPRAFEWPAALSGLAGSCFVLDSTPTHRYSYELCVHHNISQREFPVGWNSFWGLLGVWDAWSPSNTSALVGLYTDGTECGPAKQRRSTEVEFKCSVGGAYVLKGVEEPRQCFYRIQFGCPEMCDRVVVDLQELAEHYNASAVNVTVAAPFQVEPITTISTTTTITTTPLPSPVTVLPPSPVLPSLSPPPLPSAAVTSEVVLSAALEVLKTTKETLEVLEKRLALLEGKSTGESVVNNSSIPIAPPSPSSLPAAPAAEKNAPVIATQDINATVHSDPVKTSLPSINEEEEERPPPQKKKTGKKGGAAAQ